MDVRVDGTKINESAVAEPLAGGCWATVSTLGARNSARTLPSLSFHSYIPFSLSEW